MRQMIQRAHQIDGNQASGDLESRLNASKGGGSPLSEDVIQFMEPRFGADFSGVRVHTGGEAVQMNRELGAQAFTHGSDVYFGQGKEPGKNELTAHELTHVVQQTQSIQRELTDEQKQMDLKSPRFAGNQRLQNTYDNSPVMKKGEKGDAVKLLQQALIDQGFPMPISTGGGTQPPDGIFGNETFATVQKFQNQHGLGVDGIVGRQTLGKLDELNAVPQPQPPTQVTSTIEPQPDGQILGSAQATRAKAKFDQLSDADKTKFVELLQEAGSEAERQYLYKALAAGHPIAAIDTFATRIRGQDAQWLQDHLRLTGSTTGTGIQQQWSHSCNATTVQAVQGELDPIYALQVHDDNPNFGQVDDSDATHFNPNLAEQQRSMLESTYTGTKFGSHSGVAANRGNAAGGSGRWADDLLNSLSASTGMQYTPQIIGTDITLDQAITRIDSALTQGIPVPIVIGNGPNQFTHYVLMTSKSDGPPKTYTIHDPWSAQTLTKTEDELKNGILNIAGSNQMTEMEDPSVVP
jgi:peptidoglycan hydrolase-like protein with peptidoglycan-binding domain